jgi:hypothetical protein
MIFSPMPEQQPDQRESLYCKYKQLGIQIFMVLDPKGLLRGIKLPLATEIAKNLVRNLDENHRDTVSAQVMEAITLRKVWAQRYTWAPRHKQAGHQMYIGFLTSIHQQLSALKDNQAAVLHFTEQQAEEQETVEDDETDLTPDQADFLAFLEYLMTLARKAARLFEDVAQGKLPIWTASTRKLRDTFPLPIAYFLDDLLCTTSTS